MFVPSCFVDNVDPAMMAELDWLNCSEEDKEGFSDARWRYFVYISEFQQKVIRYQVRCGPLPILFIPLVIFECSHRTTTTILLISTGIVFGLVNYTKFGYQPSIYTNLEFNVFCLVIAALGLISYLFLYQFDLYVIMGWDTMSQRTGEGGEIVIKYSEDKIKKDKKKESNEDEGEDVPDGVKIELQLDNIDPDNMDIQTKETFKTKHGSVKKILFTLFATVLAISPTIAGYTYTRLHPQQPTKPN